MGCCCQGKEGSEDALDKASAVHESEEGPLANSSGRCTDCLCLLLLVACWGLMTLLGMIVMGRKILGQEI